MKKIYLIALAVATVASATAAVRKPIPVKYPSAYTQEKTVAFSKAFKDSDTGFASVDEVAGDYIWNYYGLISGDSGQQIGTVTISVVDAATGEVTIDGIYASNTGLSGKVKGVVDLTAGTLTVANRQDLGPDSYGDINYFYLKTIDEEGNEMLDGAADVESISATISGRTFTFPENYIFAIGDPDDEDLGFWKLTALNSFQEYVEPDDLIDTIEWLDLSTDAKMIDGWILPVIQYQSGEYVNPGSYPLTVTVLRHVDNPNLLAVVNPYVEESGFPLSGGQEGYIVIDITDRDFVLVNPGVFCGYLNGTKRIYCLNVEGFYTGIGYTKDVIQEELKGDISKWSTCKVQGNTMTISIPTCRFNYFGDEEDFYNWTGRADAMKATIMVVSDEFTAIDAIDADNLQEVPVEYYNLQGIRVANPENGVYIRCQGDKATKILVK